MLLVCGGCRSNPRELQEQIARSIRHGDLKTARLQVDKALSEYAGKNVEWSWRFRILKAHILASQSASTEALALLREELPAEFASTDIAVRKSMLEGMAYRVAQDFPKAEEQIRIAEDLARRHQTQLLCEVLNFRGALEVDEQKYTEAEETYNQALRLARQYQRADQEASAQVSLAWVAMKRGHFGETVERGQLALALSRSLGMQGLVAATLGNLGWSYFELGDFENALEYYNEGAEQSEKSGLRGYTAYWSTGVANSYFMLHDYAAAKNLSQRTLERARALNNAQTIAECLDTLAEIALRMGQLDEAEGYNREATQLHESGRDRFGVLESMLLSARIEAGKRHFDEAERILRAVSEDGRAGMSLQWEAQARLAEVHDAENRPAQAEREYRKSIETIERARENVDRDDLRLSFLSGGMEFYDDYIGFLIRHKRPADALQVAELSRARTLAEGLSRDAKRRAENTLRVKPEQIAGRMKATLLFYWLGQANSYLWVVTASQTAYFALPKATEIETEVKAYEKRLARMRDAQDAESSEGKQLFSMLVGPGKELIPKGGRVILLPAESLYGLNFETLVVAEPEPHFWIDDVTLSTASSLTLLAGSQSRAATGRRKILVVGNTEQASEEFPTLRQAPIEMGKIEQYFTKEDVEILEGKSATPTAYLRSNPEKFAYVHFATHGTASRTRPLESAVILSREGDSYKLYAREIIQHRLNASLVTISACNGAGTRAYSGEGLVGLSWAFLRAGAHNVIGALWEVSDASSPMMMDALYGGLKEGKDAATALREAKVAMLHSKTDNVFKKPYYWAPYQLYIGS